MRKKKYIKILAGKPKATDHLEDTGSIKWMSTEYSNSLSAFMWWALLSTVMFIYRNVKGNF